MTKNKNQYCAYASTIEDITDIEECCEQCEFKSICYPDDWPCCLDAFRLENNTLPYTSEDFHRDTKVKTQ